MNTRILAILAIAIALAVGVFVGRISLPPAGEHDQAGQAQREILYWVAPMDPSYRRDAPGKSPMGMDLVPVYADQVDAQPGMVRIDPTVVNNLGVRTGSCRAGPPAPTHRHSWLRRL